MDKALEEDKKNYLVVERHFDSVAQLPHNTLTNVDATRLVEEDLRALAAIKDPDTRHFAEVLMYQDADEQKSYKAELTRQSPEMALEVQSAGEEDLRRQGTKEVSKAQDMEAIKQERIEIARAWDVNEATKHARNHVAYHEEMSKPSINNKYEADSVIVDMAIYVRESQHYKNTLEHLSPALLHEALKHESNRTVAGQVAIGAELSPDSPEGKTVMRKLGEPGEGTLVSAMSNQRYEGKIIQYSDTHIVQQIAKHAAVSHDVSKLSNGQELLNKAAEGALQGKMYDFQYGQTQGIGVISPIQPLKHRPIAVAAPAQTTAPSQSIKL